MSTADKLSGHRGHPVRDRTDGQSCPIGVSAVRPGRKEEETPVRTRVSKPDTQNDAGQSVRTRQVGLYRRRSRTPGRAVYYVGRLRGVGRLMLFQNGEKRKGQPHLVLLITPEFAEIDDNDVSAQPDRPAAARPATRAGEEDLTPCDSSAT